MNLSDYQWGRNPRGMHGPGDNHLRWEAWKLGWIKMAFQDNTGLGWGGFALEKGMTPICRIFRPQLCGKPMDDELRWQYQEHLNIGIKWFEFYNEPNLPYEWYDGVDLRPDNMELIQALCENWLPWAEFILNGGGYPGFMALSETTEPWGDTARWMNSLLQYMFDHHYERFRNIINNGMWIATHPYILNHWYQEVAGGGPLSARQPEQVNYREGGWHFEYPYDPICQADDPGRTVWGGTPQQRSHDFFGVLGAGIAWLERLQEMFGAGWIPVVGTEGGIWSIPFPPERLRPDNRYPPFDFNSHAHGTVAMFDWIANAAPPWMFGITLWEYSVYWNNGNPIPALQLLTESEAHLKQNIPAIPALGAAPRPYDTQFPSGTQVVQQPPPQPTQVPTQEVVSISTAVPIVTLVPEGPGPIHGSPIYHFVILGVDVAPNWLFDSPNARLYWERFQPVLMPVVDFIGFLPNETSLAVTVISTPATGDALRDLIVSRWVNVWVDPIVVHDQTVLDSVFRLRVENGLRFA